LSLAGNRFEHDNAEHAAKTLLPAHYHEMTELASLPEFATTDGREGNAARSFF
jgi:hypothetical protein